MEQDKVQSPEASRRIKFHIAAFVGFVVIISTVNWPLILNLNSHVIGRPFEDAFEVVWQLWWMQSATFDQHVQPFYTPDVFYPYGWHIASGAQPAWYFLTLAPLTRMLGPTATYNVIQLVTFVIAGFGVYLLVYSLTQRRLAGLIAGCVYIVAPVITLRQGGHLHTLLGMQWLPYAVLFTRRTLATPGRFGTRRSLLAGLMFALAILGSWYFLFIATLPTIGFLLWSASDQSLRSRLVSIISTGLVCLVVLAPFAYLTWRARQEMFGGQACFSLADSDAFSLSLDRLMVPNPNHPIWGNASRQTFPLRGEQDVVSVGYVAMILALLGILKTRRDQTRPFVAMAAISLILAMGTTLHWNAHRVEIAASPSIERIYRTLDLGIGLPGGHVAIPLPGMLLHRLLPLYSSMRAWTRFEVMFMLSVAVLAGFGVRYLLKWQRFSKPIVVVLGLIVLFEGLIAPYKDFTAVSVNTRSVNQWLANQPQGTVLIEYPRPFVDKIAMYSQSLHGQRVVNGYMSQEPEYLRAVGAQLGKWPDAEAVAVLQDWEVDYVLVNGMASDDFNTVLSEIEVLAGLCRVCSFDDSFMGWNETHVFEVLQPDEVCQRADDR